MHRYINFGALCINFLEVSKNYAELTDPDSVGKYSTPISAIQSLMSVLTFGLLLSFGGVGIKKVYLAVRSANINDLAVRARSFGRSCSSGPAALTVKAGEAPRMGENIKVGKNAESFSGSNAMHSGSHTAAAPPKPKGAWRDLAVEMTRFRSKKAPAGVLQGQQRHELSTGLSEAVALPSPPTFASSTTTSTSTANLPAGWAAYRTLSGGAYYFNATTGVTSWTLPV